MLDSFSLETLLRRIFKKPGPYIWTRVSAGNLNDLKKRFRVPRGQVYECYFALDMSQVGDEVLRFRKAGSEEPQLGAPGAEVPMGSLCENTYGNMFQPRDAGLNTFYIDSTDTVTWFHMDQIHWNGILLTEDEEVWSENDFAFIVRWRRRFDLE